AGQRERLREELREAVRRGVDVAEVVGAVAAPGDDADHRAGVLADRRPTRIALADRQAHLELVAAQGRLARRHRLADREDRDRVFAHPGTDRQARVVLPVADRADALARVWGRPEAYAHGLHGRDLPVEDQKRDVRVAEHTAVGVDDRPNFGVGRVSELG